MQIFLFVWFVNFGISVCILCFHWTHILKFSFEFRNLGIMYVMYVICPPCLPSPYTNTSLSYPLYFSYLFHYSCTFQSVCYFVCFLLFASIPIVDHLLCLFLYSIYCLSFYGSYMSIVFKNGSMSLQRAIYDPFLRAILIPNYTYFHP